MISYLIKSTVCLIVLLIIYHTLLEQEKMHRFNRWFLLVSLIFSLSIPLLTVNIGAPAGLSSHIEEINSRISNPPRVATQYEPNTSANVPNVESSGDPTISYIHVLIGIYFMVASILTARLFRNLYCLFRKARRYPRKSYKNVTLVLVDGCGVPHSFFKTIFVDKKLYESGKINQAILTHELTHARQWHSVDILFIELLKIAFWFNPVLWFYKKAMQLNHEFLADETVIAQHRDVLAYRRLLLKIQSGKQDMPLVSSIHYSITKKRFIMMTKKSTRLRTVAKQLALIPLLAALIFTFSTKKVAAQDVSTMSLTELMEVINEKVTSVETLTDAEKDKLQSLVSKIQKELNPQAPPPPAPTPLSESKEETLKRISQSLEEHNQFYSKIEPIPENKKKLETIYERYLQLEDTLIKLQQEIKGNPPLAPPRPLNPAERIEAGPEKSAPPKPPQKISEQNILRVLVNEEGLILMDEEPVPLDRVTAKIKAFITNNGADPNLSESPQKATIAIKTSRKTPHKTYTKMMDNIQAAYLEVRNIAAQAEFGINYQKLVENSPAQTEIQEMYPVRISIADPEQVEDKTKKPPPPQPAKIADRNLLKIWINREGLILMDEEPTPLEKVKAKVKEFVTNNGDDPEL